MFNSQAGGKGAAQCPHDISAASTDSSRVVSRMQGHGASAQFKVHCHPPHEGDVTFQSSKGASVGAGQLVTGGHFQPLTAPEPRVELQVVGGKGHVRPNASNWGKRSCR